MAPVESPRIFVSPSPSPSSSSSWSPPTIPPDDERRRLRALHDAELLDTPPEPCFDELVALAAQLCGTPMSALNLIDEHRYWTKARFGLEAGEGPRSFAFCSHAIGEVNGLVVSDARLDLRFAAYPSVTANPGVRFYAGVPLLVGGQAIGALCVVDSEPRDLADDKLEALRLLSRHATREIERHVERRQQARELARVRAAAATGEVLLELIQEIARGADLDAAFSAVLARVGRAADWTCGEIWIPSPGTEPELRRAASWSRDPGRTCAFEDAAHALTFRPGEGLPGTAWARRAPEWRKDFTRSAHVPRKLEAEAAGFESAVALPVLASDEVVAVIAFYFGEARAYDEAAVALLGAVAAQLGTFVERKRTEDALRSSEARLRQLTGSAIDGVVSVDASGLVRSWNAAASRIFGLAAHEIEGRPLEAIMPERFREMHRRGLARVVAGGASNLAGKTVELIGLRANGEEFPLELSLGSWTHGGAIYFTGILRDISERRRLEETLRAQMEVYQALVRAQDDIGQGLGLVDHATQRFLHVNHAMATIYGRTAQEIVALPSYFDLFEADELAAVRARLAQRLAGDGREHYETTARRPSGERVAVEVATAPSGGSTAVVVVRDIRERVRAREALERVAEELAGAATRFEVLLSSIDDGVLLIDADRRITFVNRAFGELFSMAPEAAVQMERRDLIARTAACFDDPAEFLAAARAGAERPFDSDTTFELQRPVRRVVRCRARLVRLPQGDGQLVTFSDVTAEVDLARERETLARTDALTGLVNRRGGDEALKRETARARREGAPLSLLLIDIDHFKRVNDGFGHAVGDRVLAGTARLLRDEVRDCDVVVRWGGEEILVVLPRADRESARAVGERCRRAVEAARWPGLPTITVSIGVAELEGTGDGPGAGAGAATDTSLVDGDAGAALVASALERADAALYRAKGDGRNQVRD